MNAEEEVLRSGKTWREWYREVYLQSDHWKNLRLLAMKHHGKRCHSCYSKEQLDVHHLRYGNIYDVKVQDLQVLCRVCHMQEHGEATPKKSANNRTMIVHSKKHKKILMHTSQNLKSLKLLNVEK